MPVLQPYLDSVVFYYCQSVLLVSNRGLTGNKRQWALEKKRKTVSHSEGVSDFYFSSCLFSGQANTLRGHEHEDEVSVSPCSKQEKLSSALCKSL